jgi:hypothetical protein
MVSRDADKVLPGLAADEHAVLLEGDKEDIDVEGGQVDLVDIKGCDVLGDRRALRGRESVWVCVDLPEGHGCCVN